jgi:hypothetical protein
VTALEKQKGNFYNEKSLKEIYASSGQFMERQGR